MRVNSAETFWVPHFTMLAPHFQGRLEGADSRLACIPSHVPFIVGRDRRSDEKVQQELMRHASIEMTMNVYRQDHGGR